MMMEADRMRNLKLTADLLEKEKGAVVGELRRHMDSPAGLAFDEVHKFVLYRRALSLDRFGV